MRSRWFFLAFSVAVLPGPLAAESLQKKLTELPCRIVYESHVGDNWELLVMNADGSGKKNLTNTKDSHELYPQASPDGSKICFISDVLVVIGPLNEHVIAEENRPPYENIRAPLREWLEQEQVTSISPAVLPSERYGDASHPLTAGYRQLAEELVATPEFQSWLK